MQQRFKALLIDVSLVVVTALGALYLRDNLIWSFEHVHSLLPYLIASLVSSLIFLPLLNVHRTVWRFTSFQDMGTLCVAALVIVFLSTIGAFAFNRAEGVARSIPFLHFFLLSFSMVLLRLLVRLRHVRRRFLQVPILDNGMLSGEKVLVLGVNEISDLFVRSVLKFHEIPIQIVGFVGQNERQNGRYLHGVKVLGLPNTLRHILQDLEVHGISVQRVVVTVSRKELTADAQDALDTLENSSSVFVDYFGERLGILSSGKPMASVPSALAHPIEGDVSFQPSERASLPALQNFLKQVNLNRPYWKVKPVFEGLIALSLLVLLSPLFLILSLVIMIDVGRPIFFWQSRIGSLGRAFKVYKFRTMKNSRNEEGLRVSDHDRVSTIGAFLRRWRLDELPQLVNVLAGEMSFVGPRPLLLSEQSKEIIARLAVRPGITGWAQVHGGREVKLYDKAALDLWYIKNASFSLDILILAKTLQFLFGHEKLNSSAVEEAWAEICSQKLSSNLQRDCSSPNPFPTPKGTPYLDPYEGAKSLKDPDVEIVSQKEVRVASL